jgi:hypothetical protein
MAAGHNSSRYSSTTLSTNSPPLPASRPCALTRSRHTPGATPSMRPSCPSLGNVTSGREHPLASRR